MTFFTESGKTVGFRLSGHATLDSMDVEGKTVCAAVSSAAYMTANTVTEIIGLEADASVDDGEMSFRIKNRSEKAQWMLEGFKLHITELAAQYPDRIRVISEV